MPRVSRVNRAFERLSELKTAIGRNQDKLAAMMDANRAMLAEIEEIYGIFEKPVSQLPPPKAKPKPKGLDPAIMEPLLENIPKLVTHTGKEWHAVPVRELKYLLKKHYGVKKLPNRHIGEAMQQLFGIKSKNKINPNHFNAEVACCYEGLDYADDQGQMDGILRELTDAGFFGEEKELI